MDHPYTEIKHCVSTDVFNKKVRGVMEQCAVNGIRFFVATLDIDHFNYINDLFDFQTGDLILQKVAEHFEANLKENEFFTRLHADIFAFCIYSTEYAEIMQQFSMLTSWNEVIKDILPVHYSVKASGGIVAVVDASLPVSVILDKANYARQKAKKSITSRFCFYDEKMSGDLRWQKIVTFSMEAALENREFEMYLQPKIALQSNQIVGAEALVRWNSPAYGIITPDRFIPILEQNGFIRQLDFFMLEEACHFIKDSAIKEIPTLPISVNFSKLHLSTENLVEKIFYTVSQTGIETGMIEIEFTESMSINSFERLVEVVSELKRLGFRVSLDDFGSAYSSLNCLKDLPIDTIKIDKGFLNESSNTEKGRMIITKIVELMKSLHMHSVMEGVENGEQADFLQKLSCDFGQGYFYARPMPQTAYVDFLKEGDMLSDTQTGPNRDAAVKKNAMQLSTASQPPVFQTESVRNNAGEDLKPNNTLQKSLTDKIKNLETLVQSECAAKEALRLSEERYRVIIEQSDDVMFEWDFTTDTISFSEKYSSMFAQTPICDNMSCNTEIRTRIHPDDLPAFEKWVEETYQKAGSHQVEFRNIDTDGSYMWVRCSSTAISDENGKVLRAVGLFSDISVQKNELDALTYKSQRDPLTKLLNKEEIPIRVQALLDEKPDRKGAFFMIDIDNFKTINDNLGHQLGDGVLVELTRKLKEFLPAGSVVGRMGGDEIGAYMDISGYDEACAQADALVQVLRTGLYGSAVKYNVSVSVGAACYPSHGRSFEELYHLADIALYESKQKGKNCYTMYRDHMTGSLIDNRTPVEWSESFLNTYFQEDLPFQIFEMLYESKDIDASIPMILELLGKHFKVDRVYIFQNDPDPSFVSNIHEWCAPGILSEREKQQHISYESLRGHLSQYSGEGVYCCQDISKAAKETHDLCAPENVKSCLQCAIYNEGDMTGFIGFDMYTSCHSWSGEEIAILGYLSRILSVFLLKSDIALELQATYHNYVEMVENLNGYVYVVDPVTYEVLYINNPVKALGIEKGDACYKMAFRSNAPCKNCPIRRLSDTINYATDEIYSDLLQGWVSSSASKLKWEGKRDAVLICCTDISKYKGGSPEAAV